MKSRVIVAAIIEKNGKILLGKKPKDVGPYPNVWHLLGGGVHLESESLEDALIREIKEEVGITVKNIERVSFDEDYEPDKHGEKTHYVFLVYKMRCASGKIRAQDDVKELRWFNKQELKTILHTRPSMKLFQELGWL